MAACEEAGPPSPSGEAHEHFGGAEPCGTSPPVQTDQFSEGGLEEVGQEGRLRVRDSQYTIQIIHNTNTILY